MAKTKKFTHPRMLVVDPNFKLCEIEEGHEYMPNGIFAFNITRLIEHIEGHPHDLLKVEIDVATYFDQRPNFELNEDYVEQADLGRPLIFAEIAPDRLEMGMRRADGDLYARGYNLLDGHHRLAKARKLGIQKLPAYVLRMEQHLPFLERSYETYVDCWNGKLEEKW